MILKETLQGIVKSQEEELKLYEKGIEREKLTDIDVNLPFAIIISGVRRCGKSTLLRQLMSNTSGAYYFGFDDVRVVDFETTDFQRLDEVFKDEYGPREYYFFDEIQNADKWEVFVRTLLNRKKHVVVTGSNASLLSRELGTRLTGRHLTHELFPFSFKEYLKFTGERAGEASFRDYLVKGGFPEYLKAEKTEILQELLKDILMRDIAVRHKIRNVKTLREMALYLLSNVSKEFSYNSLKKTFDLGSINSVISFISYFEESYLLFSVPRFDYSAKKQLINPKKIYSIDNGLAAANSVSFSSDKGRMLENAVFLQLRRKHKSIFYFKEKNECDFLVKKGTKILSAVQVCHKLEEENRDRETAGLLEAMGKFKLVEGLILTHDQEDELKINNKKILIKPVWKWLLEKEQHVNVSD